MRAQREDAIARRGADQDEHVVLRPVLPGAPGRFPLTYVRARPRTAAGAAAGRVPVLVLPGGPGLASAAPYVRFRALASRRGLDVLMVEHRGIGLSRRDEHGDDLPREAVTVEHVVEDLAAVLEHAGVPRVVVYGSSYGTYLAQAFGARHPGAVEAMVLDSPMLSVQDLAIVRAHRRRLFWHGEDPTLAPVAATVRALAADGVPMAELSQVVQVVHEFAGPEVLHRLLLARRRGRLQRTWRRISRLGLAELDGPGAPYFMEPDLVAGIAYGQLGFGLPPDGGPLDPQLPFAEVAAHRPAYAGEPFDLPAELPGFTWPTVVLSGERDLRTPRPVAERVAGLAPGGVLVPLAATGHSALDTHRLAALHVAGAAAAGTVHRLPGLADRIAALPRRGPSRLLGAAITAAVTTGAGLP